MKGVTNKKITGVRFDTLLFTLAFINTVERLRFEIADLSQSHASLNFKLIFYYL